MGRAEACDDLVSVDASAEADIEASRPTEEEQPLADEVEEQLRDALDLNSGCM